MPGGGAHPPYQVVPEGARFVVKNGLGEVKSTFTDRKKAERYTRALYAAAARTSAERRLPRAPAGKK